ncbi:uncharacterized protein F4822DRAFT_339903 [Hypoxylon trugodes]|uniref:uncharacterized protein n=1 Tax=Hypoxylon trugodes TaxID=326681 RepID=UPI00218CB0D4|nr:uncharacterized protein F4822DRAFT_339903 [Hypoxylon trugodes]KAI1385282.1 hypothetical protein F4822DRAFT_339903 [Hypoxylon trugodes]
MAPSRATARLGAALRQASQHQLRSQRQQFLNSSKLQRSYYHSYDHPPPPGVFSAAENAILSAAYRHVPEHGFTQHTLSLGARDAGYLDISTNLLPEGPFSLIRYHLLTQREALAPRSKEIFGSETNTASSAASLHIPEKVERLAWERLLGNQEVNHRWQEVSHNPQR